MFEKVNIRERNLTNSNKEIDMLDISEPEHVEVRIDYEGAILWINVDGKCALRISRIPEIILLDDRLTVKETPNVYIDNG